MAMTCAIANLSRWRARRRLARARHRVTPAQHSAQPCCTLAHCSVSAPVPPTAGLFLRSSGVAKINGARLSPHSPTLCLCAEWFALFSFSFLFFGSRSVSSHSVDCSFNLIRRGIHRNVGQSEDQGGCNSKLRALQLLRRTALFHGCRVRPGFEMSSFFSSFLGGNWSARFAAS